MTGGGTETLDVRARQGKAAESEQIHSGDMYKYVRYVSWYKLARGLHVRRSGPQDLRFETETKQHTFQGQK